MSAATITPASIQSTFDQYDTDKSNTLTPDELVPLLNHYENTFEIPASTETEVFELIKSRFGEKTECLTKSQFEELITSIHTDLNESKNDLMESFKFFDKNGDGNISFEELKKEIKKLRKKGKIDKIGKDDLKKMFEAADEDGNGTVDFDEFVKIINNDIL